MKQRVRSNEARIRTLETGDLVIEPSWNDACERADRLVASITALELGVRGFTLSEVDDSSTREVLQAFPGFDRSDLDAIADRGATAEEGAVNWLQGYVGEERAHDAINSGAVPVPEGRYAVLAESSNQPGYDLRLVSEGGAEELVAEVKVSDSASLIREHFLRYPETNIVYTNSEAAQDIVGDAGITVLRPGEVFPDEAGRFVVDIGFTKDQIRTSAKDLMSGAAADGADGVSFGDQLLDSIPWIYLLVIAGRAAYEYFDTDIDASFILRVAAKRLRQTILASGARTATTVLTHEPSFAAIAGLGTLFGVRAVDLARKDLRNATARLRHMGAVLTKIRHLPSAMAAN
jgi:hypothetical protein